MNKKDIRVFKEWFTSFSNSFLTSAVDDTDRKNYILKITHTEEVRKNAVEIAIIEEFSEDDLLTGEVAALFHDVGRFPQYAEYKTFRDSISTNHGLLGVKTLQEHGVLDFLSENVVKNVFSSIKYHNVFKTPEGLTEKEQKLLNLVRDADKLDIWEVFILQAEMPAEKQATAAMLGLPETSGYSVGITDIIFDSQIVPLSKVHAANDYHLLRLSWIFDLNFKASIKLLLDRKLIERTLSILPQDERILGLKDFLCKKAESMLI